MAQTPSKPRSLVEFLMAQRTVACPVCKALTPELREQVNHARHSLRITIATICDWLTSEYGIKLTPEQMRRHYGGQHEGKAAQ